MIRAQIYRNIEHAQVQGRAYLRSVQGFGKMTSISVRPEDRSDGVSNFRTWKVRVINILEEHDLDQFVTNELEILTSAAGRSTFKKNQAKAF